jgi:DNA polymerase
MKPDCDTAIPALREWLRSEQRLGVPHWPVPPAAASARRRAGEGAVEEPSAGQTGPNPRPDSAAQPRPESDAPRPIRLASSQATLGLFPDAADLPPPCSQELSPAEAEAALAHLDANFVKGCTKCPLHQHRTQTVFGVGSARPELVFVGEGPGADEDAQGLPFVGRAGQLLTRMIAAMTLTREQVYICNVVKCRPPGNRTPADEEMQTCSSYLFRQLAILRPKVIVALGRPATQTLLVTRSPITALRGEFHEFPPAALAHLGLPPTRLMPTFHPAYLLRNPAAKADAWKDLQNVMHFLGIRVPRRQ